MSLKLEIFCSLPFGKQEEFAEQISDYTQGKLDGSPQMLPVSPLDIHQKYVGVVALEGDIFAGYIAAIQPEDHNGQLMSEVGTLWVPTEHRNKGIAHRLVGSITKSLMAIDTQPYALCNPLSEGIFKGTDYVEGTAGDIPPSAISLCGNCPAKPVGGGCCDKILLYKGAVQ